MNREKNSMRIGIDIRSLQTESQFRGIGVYTYNLIKHLVQTFPEEDYVFFASASRAIKPLEPELRQKIIWLHRPARMTSLTDQLFWYHTLKTHRIDVFHATEFAVPRYAPCKCVITIHDLIPLIFQEYKRVAKWQNYLVYLLKFHSTRWAANVIAVSESVRNDLIRLLHIPEEKIVVIYEGFQAEYFRPAVSSDTVERVKKKYHLDQAYVIFPCGFEPRKNVLTTIRAFREALTRLPTSYQLILVGNLTAQAHKAQQYVQEHALAQQVRFLGYVPHEELSHLYNGAALCVFPSLYEGFGLPVLEAMACGVPVVTSNDTSIPEVVGESAILVNPHSVKAITDGIVTVLTTPALRKNLQQQGMHQAALFSWDNAARATLNAYRLIVDDFPGRS